MIATSKSRPWQQEPYVWLLIAFPAAAVFGGIATAILAVQSDDGLVNDDYYKHGLEISRTLERDDQATALQITMHATIDQSNNRLIAKMSSESDYTLPLTLRAQLAHATRKGQDIHTTLIPTESGEYISDLPPLPIGQWYLEVGTARWRLVERVATE